MGWLMKLLGSGVIDSVGGVVKTVFGDKAARDQQAADDQAAVRSEFAAEFTGPERIGWWNSLVDGLNRLPRPLMTFGTVVLFVWCALDPVEFATSMQALQLIPDQMWIVLSLIVGFWFGSKAVEGFSKAAPVSPDKVKAVLAGMQATRALEPQPAPTPTPTPPMPDPTYQTEMADTKKPLSNAAILEWNRRRQDGWKP